MRLKDILNVLRKGGQVKNPATWKNTSATAEIIFSILVVVTGLIRFFGFDLILNDEILMLIATGIAMFLTAASAVITLISSRKVGLPGLEPVEEYAEKGSAAPLLRGEPGKGSSKQTMGRDY